MEEGTADGARERGGEHGARGSRSRGKAKLSGMIEDANSQRVEKAALRASGSIGARKSDRIEESPSVSEFGAQDPVHGGEPVAIGRGEAKSGMIVEDGNSQRVQQTVVRAAAGVGAAENDLIESSLVSGFDAQDPGMEEDGRERGGDPEAIGRVEAKSGMIIEDANSQRVQQADRAAGIGAGENDQMEATLISEFDARDPGIEQERGGESEAIGRVEAKSDMIEDGNSPRVQQADRAASIGAGENDQMEASLVSEFGAQDPGMERAEDEMEEGASHLFTKAMKLQLRAQILVLGEFVKGTAPNPDWLEDACLEPAIGAESVLLESVEISRGAQDGQCGNACIDEVPSESNLPRMSSAFRDADARMFRFSGAADIPTPGDAIKDELHSAGRLSTPGEPSSSGKEFSFRDDSLAQETEIGPSGHLLITYDHPRTPRSNTNMADDSPANENCIVDSDKHLDLAQASAQDALTTATSALAQSHMVWARLHSEDHSEEGIARDARLASVAATVAAASSVAKAAVEAARAIAEVSMDAFIQASGYQFGDARTPQFGSAKSRPLQIDGWERTPNGNGEGSATPSQQRAEMLESVVQAAGKAAEAATQAGAVLAKANPMIQSASFSSFWPQKPDLANVEDEGDEANEIDAANEMDGLRGGDEVGALNEMDVVNELDGVNEEDLVEKMDIILEKDIIFQGKLDAVSDVREQLIANRDEATADAVAAAVSNGDGVTGANEAGLIGADEVTEPYEQEKRSNSTARKFQRGKGRGQGVSSRGRGQGVSSRGRGLGVSSRGRGRGVSSRGRGRGITSRGRGLKLSSTGQRAKISVGISLPPVPVQSPENTMHGEVGASGNLEDVREESVKSKKRGSKRMKSTPSGEDSPAQGVDGATHETVEVLDSQKKDRGRNPRAQKSLEKLGSKRMKNTPLIISGEDSPAPASAQGADDATHETEVLESQKKDRGRNSRAQKNLKKLGPKRMKHTPLIISGEDSPAPAPAQGADDAMHETVEVLDSQTKDLGRNSRAQKHLKKLGSKRMKNNPLIISGEDSLSPAPVLGADDATHETVEVLDSQTKDRGRNSRAQKRGSGVNVRGKKLGTKPSESRSLNTTEEDVPATAPAQSAENELLNDDKSPKDVRNPGRRTRSAKHVENTTVSPLGKDTTDRDVKDPETDGNTLEVRDNAIQEGSAVEVMIDEVGLRGGWFAGTVLRIISNEVFVELLDLLTDDGKANVREWFPLLEGFNPSHPRRHARPVHPFTIFSEAGSRKRRRVALGSQTWHMGDQVDAFIQDAWWEGLVAEINDLDPTKATVYFPEENDTQVVKTWDLRPSFQWKDNKWVPWKSSALVEDERPPKRQKPGGSSKVVTPDEMNVGHTSNEGRADGSSIHEEIPESHKSPAKDQNMMEEYIPGTHKSPVKDHQENGTPMPRLKSKAKRSKTEIVSPERRGRSANNAHQTDSLAPGTSKGMDVTADASVPTASPERKIPLKKGKQAKLPLKKGKQKRRKKRFT